MESKAISFEQWNKAYGFGLRIPQLFTGGEIVLPILKPSAKIVCGCLGGFSLGASSKEKRNSWLL